MRKTGSLFIAAVSFHKLSLLAAEKEFIAAIRAEAGGEKASYASDERHDFATAWFPDANNRNRIRTGYTIIPTMTAIASRMTTCATCKSGARDGWLNVGSWSTHAPGD